MSNVIELESQRKVGKDMEDRSMDPVHEEDILSLDLQMIKRSIASGLGMLDKAIEAEGNDFSPEGAAVVKAIQRTLKGLGDLTRLFEHDMTGLIKSQQLQANGLYESQLHLQCLIEALRGKDLLAEKDLESTWAEKIAPMLEELQKSQS